MKKIIISAAAAILIIAAFFSFYIRSRNGEFDLVEVKRGEIYQEIFESGQILKGERVNLNFNVAGRINEIKVRSGDEVRPGQELARLDDTDFRIQLEEAKIALELAQLNLSKLLSGGTSEEIRIAETQLENTRVSFNLAEDNLEKSYQTSITVLDGSYPSIYNALDFSRELVLNYISIYDEDARKIMAGRDVIEVSEKNAKESLEQVKKTLGSDDIEKALLVMEKSLRDSFNSLEAMRQAIEGSDIYKDKIPSTEKASLESLKTSLNNFLANIISSRQSISAAKSSLQSAEKGLIEAENRLALARGEARQVDIDLYQAQIRQAQARVSLYQNQLNNSRLTSPINGKVVEVKKRVGELAQPSFQDVVVTILPIVPYEIKVDIYEENIVNVSIGNPVEISLVSFPGESFRGKVISISPAEKIINEVVYYEATIGFEETPENIRPGMTADIVVKTDIKEDVLMVHRDVIQRKNNKRIVEVFEDDLIKEREIEIGLIGSDNMVEVVSGLQEGEKIVLRR